MAAFQTQSEQQNSTSVVNTNPNQAFGPSAIPQPNVPSQQINCTNVGMKRKSSDSEQHETPLKQPAWLPQQQPEQQRQDLFCEICIVQLNSVSQALQHRQGKIHLNKAKKVEKFRTMLQNPTNHGISSTGPIHPQLVPNPPPVTLPVEEPRKQLGSVNFKCDICQKIFNSESQAVQHFQGQKHKLKMQSVGGSNTEIHSTPASQQRQNGTHCVAATGNNMLPFSLTNGSENNGLYCEPCGLTANSKTQMDTHLQGAKHKNIVASKRTQNHSGPVLRCEDCMTTFNSQIQLTQHLTSPKHINKVQKKQRTGTGVQFRGQPRGRGRGQGRARGVSRGGQSYRGRGTFNPPPLGSSFVKAHDNTSTNNSGFPFLPPAGGAPF
ncbi:uncharacterized protein LOC144665880 [Oculina patagonica]